MVQTILVSVCGDPKIHFRVGNLGFPAFLAAMQGLPAGISARFKLSSSDTNFPPVPAPSDKFWNRPDEIGNERSEDKGCHKGVSDTAPDDAESTHRSDDPDWNGED